MFCCGNCFSSSSKEIDLTKEEIYIGHHLDRIRVNNCEPAKGYLYRKFRSSIFVEDCPNRNSCNNNNNNNDNTRRQRKSHHDSGHELNQNGLSVEPLKNTELSSSPIAKPRKKSKSSKEDPEESEFNPLDGLIHEKEDQSEKSNEIVDEMMSKEEMRKADAAYNSADENATITLLPERAASSSADDMGLDYNAYATKKNITQGLLDIALLTANATQLKYVLQKGTPGWSRPMAHYIYLANLTLIAVSIVLQILVGIALFYNNRHNVTDRRFKSSAESCNTLILMMVFVITVINVFIVVFIDGLHGQLN